MKQNSEIRFKCSSEEKQKIKQKAEQVGMSVKSFLLYLAKNSTLRVILED